jgi:hypothetical protein
VVNLQRLETVHRHGRKRLVDLNEVDVVYSDVELGQQLWDRDAGADTHDPGRKAGDGGADVLCEDRLAELFGGRALHHQHRGCTVGELGRVARVALIAVRQERRLDLLQALKRGAIADALVLGQRYRLALPRLRIFNNRRDGRNLVVEPARLLGYLGSSVGLRRKLVLALARDIEIVADVFRRLAHGLHAVTRLGVLQHLVDEWAFQPIAARGHALRAQGQADLDAADGDLVGDVLHRLEPRRTEAVQRRARRRVREAGGEHGRAHIIGGLGIRHVAAADVFDEGRVEVGLGDDLLERLDEEAVEGRVFEAALVCFGKGRAEGKRDDNVVGVLGGTVMKGQLLVSSSCGSFFFGSLLLHMSVVGAYIAASPLVDGVICDTMDLRRSVILTMFGSRFVDGELRFERSTVNDQCGGGDEALNGLVGQPLMSRGSRSHTPGHVSGNCWRPEDASSSISSFELLGSRVISSHVDEPPDRLHVLCKRCLERRLA